MAFKDKIKELRVARNMTQEEVAKGTGLSASSIGMYEQGRRKPSFEVLEIFADFFNVDMNTLTAQGYYIDPETAAYAEELRTNPELKVLFSASKDLTKEQMKEAYNYIKFLKSREKNNDD
ncbi:helix-turn-helix domain-containing protein [Megasphaera vaginalis (ex Srinivasan et al. 2021)]|uniref:DNA-binding helix-turn-helix protein n=1 Tax=Megasphaera vaginalis (ex Srinivasan et al. 2021) TaxID=1111454 RepID=U7UMX6_9FIRM|nr:helix-turn-helix domain-containing protein [Megasphaera vaginalis (ex Srinivasan et al. 2021)]ERT60254.1 DNA-binding helix-turn-helix protein [Megasphaera vaginalis (ex Srinivasan et al. 2021)]